MVARLARWFSRLLQLALVALGGWLLVGYLLRWPLATPPPLTAVDSRAEHIAQLLSDRHLFGIAVVEPVVTNASADHSSFSLVGLIADPRAKGGVALLRKTGTNEPPLVVKIGQEVSPGVAVRYVSPREVEVGGARLSLPDKDPANSGGNPASGLAARPSFPNRFHSPSPSGQAVFPLPPQVVGVPNFQPPPAHFNGASGPPPSSPL